MKQKQSRKKYYRDAEKKHETKINSHSTLQKTVVGYLIGQHTANYIINKLYLKKLNRVVCSSYLHCEWGDIDQLAKKDKRVHAKVKRYKQKRDTSLAFLNEVCQYL